MNNVAVNLQVQVVVWTKVFNFLGTMPGSGILGRMVILGLTFEELPDCFRSTCIILHSHQSVCDGSNISTSSAAFVITCVFHHGHPSG